MELPPVEREYSARKSVNSRDDDRAPRRRGVGIAAVILGSISVLLAIVPLINYLAIVTAILGVILGSVALKRKRRTKGLGIAGLITSLIALVLSVVLATTYTVYVVGFLQTAGLLPGGDPIVVDEPAVPGSLEDPVLVGTRVAFAGPDGSPEWEITPGSPTLDATPILTAAPYGNPPPPAGFQYAVLPLTITYVGATTGSAYDVFVRFLTPDGTAYAAGDLVVVIPEPLISVGDLAPGASGTGYVAVLVPTEAVATGAWEVSTGSSPGFYFRSE